MGKAIKSNIQSWGDATTCHGVRDLINSSSIVAKAFWIVLITGSVCLATWQIYKLLVRFGSSPHYVTKSYLEEPDSVPFPNVTICNINRVHRDRAIKLGMVNESGDLDPDLLNYLFASFPATYDLAFLEKLYLPYFLNRTFEELKRMKEKYERFLQRTNLTSTNPMDLVHILGYKCHEMISDCKWAQWNFKCCDSATRIVNAYGLCYSISPEPTIGEERAGQNIPGMTFITEPSMN